MTKTQPISPAMIGLAAALATAIFLVDLYLPLGVAGGVPYVALVLFGWWFRGRRYIFVLAAVSSVLTAAGYFLSPEGDILWIVLTNRFLALLMIWGVAVLVALIKGAEEGLRQARDNLERLVRERTKKLAKEVADRRRVEEVLRESEKRFRTLIDSSNQGILVHRHHRPHYANRTLVRMFGYDTIEDILGLDSTAALFAPEERARMRGYHEARLRGEFAPTDYQFKGLRKDGSEIWLNNRAFQIDWEDGPAICTTVFDITERKRSEKALRESEERLRLILDHLADAVITIDETGVVQSFSPAAERIFGYAAEEVLGKFINMLMPEPYRSEHDTYLVNYLRTGKAKIIGMEREVVGRRKDGTTFPMVLGVSEMQALGKRLFCGIARDLTMRKLREQEKEVLQRELQQAQKLEAIGQLAGGIAHEINTPIQYIGDNLGFLGKAHGDIATVLEAYGALAQAAREAGVLGDTIAAVDKVVEEADLDYLLEELPAATEQSLTGTDQVSRIVLAMKEFSHPGRKEKSATDVNAAIESTLTVCRNEWKHVADVDTDLDAALPPVVCLAGELNQVFLNLIINGAHAIDASGGEGKGCIRVSTRKDADWVEIKVADTGGGIPADIRSKIFDPFFTTKEVGRGTGQGLAICRDIVVNKHGGKIFFETEEGKGTTFVIRLPLDGQAKTSEAA
ncbi:MAG: PAS domain S-box protein [Alphaproteobacteria bacterium]